MAKSLEAIYVNGSTFKIPSETDLDGNPLVDVLVKNRRIKANCDVDGYRYSSVASVSYDSNNDETTVNLNEITDESGNSSSLTSNLIEAWFGVVASGLNQALPFSPNMPQKDFGEVSSDITLDVSQYRIFRAAPTSGITIDVTNLFSDGRAVAFLALRDPANYNLNFTSKGGGGKFIKDSQLKFSKPESGWYVSTESYKESSTLSNVNKMYGGYLAYGGERYYTADINAHAIKQYNLSTPNDITTASYTKTLDLPGDEAYGEDVALSHDGTLLYVAQDGDSAIREYELSTSFELDTAVATGNAITSVSYTETIDLSYNGKFMLVSGYGGTYQIEFDTAFDVTTALSPQSVSGHDCVSVRYSTEGKYGYLCVWDTPPDMYQLSTKYDFTTAEYLESGSVNSVYTTSFTDDGKNIIRIDRDGNADVYSLSGVSSWDILTLYQLNADDIYACQGYKGGGPFFVPEHGDNSHSVDYILEAPNDGNQYVRKDLGWVNALSLPLNDLGSISGEVDLDISQYKIFEVDIIGDTTFNVKGHLSGARALSQLAIYNGGSYNLSFTSLGSSADFVWGSDNATTSGEWDIVNLQQLGTSKVLANIIHKGVV